MSIRVMAHVWDHGPEDRNELLVLLALADFCNDAGECWPSMQTIARKARMTERGVQKIIRRMQEVGLVTVDVGGGRAACNKYRIVTEKVNAKLRTGNPELETPNTEHRLPVQKPRTPVQKTPNTGSPEPLGSIIDPEEPPFSSPAKKPKRAVALPENWVPNETNVRDAKNRGFTDQEIEHEADKFRNHHLARGTTFKNWDAGWRTWLGKAVEFRNRRVADGPKSSGYGQGSSIASIVARRRLEGEV